ncbi:9379_t:CDS:1, partial [Ambispora leptoticha]
YQSQLIAQLQQKVETLENFNQQLMQLWREDNLYANQCAAQFATFTESQNF